MYIKTYMSTPVITVSPDITIPKARNILKSNNFRHLPITDENSCLVGIVTDRDLRSAYPSLVLPEEERRLAMEKLEKTPVSEIMSTGIQTLSPYDTIDDGLLLLDKLNVGALPVVDKKGRVRGMFSIRDLIRAYRKIFGIGEKGSALVGISVGEEPKIMGNIIRALEEHEVPVTRICMVENEIPQKEKTRIVYIRVQTFNIKKVRKLLSEIGFDVLEPPENS